jgi:protein disulfide-isomerase
MRAHQIVQTLLVSLLSISAVATTPSGSSETAATTEGPGEYTEFNNKRIPPLTELKAATFDQNVKDGYWLVEFFSPYCHHCHQFAPTWQTLYEFYQSSDPVPQTSGSGESHNDLNSFTRFYNFKFARVDCVADGDTCAAQSIQSYPSIILYKDGKVVETKVGAKEMKEMVDWVESTLETIRPGSRPPGGPKVIPKAGDKVTSADASAKLPLTGSRVVASTSNKPNPSGKSVELTPETFRKLVTDTRDPWFIKFYAPWCHHCKDLAPNWQGMARKMQQQLNIGEVNCEAEKKLCKDLKIPGYPTILFFREGERIEYEGLRGLGDLINYASKAVEIGQGIVDVTASLFEEMEKRNEVIFLYFYDDATTSEDLAALDRMALSLISHAKIVKTTDPELFKRFKISTWPRLLVSRDGKATYYPPISPREMRDVHRVLHWMRSVWLPIVPELTASNAKEIMHGKLVVLGILSRDSPDFAVYKKEIKNAALEWIDKQSQAFQLERQELRDAKQLRIEEAEDRNDQRALRAAKSIRINMDDIERKEVGFAWVDGQFWERWVKTTFGIRVVEGERVVINDQDNHRYWENTMTGNPIVPSRTSIIETLPRVVANPPKIPYKRTMTILGHVWWVVKTQMQEHPLVTVFFSLFALAVMALWLRKYFKVAQSGFINLSEKGGMDGLLGNTAGGKVD